VGREGVAGGLGAAVSEQSPVDLMVQVPGIAFRLDSRALRTRIDQSSPFRTRWLEHLHTLVAQMARRRPSAIAITRRHVDWRDGC
jgi:hypothetical protein